MKLFASQRDRILIISPRVRYAAHEKVRTLLKMDYVTLVKVDSRCTNEG